jgi:hypothetical protein
MAVSLWNGQLLECGKRHVLLFRSHSEIVIMHDTRPVPIPAVSVSRAVASQLEVTAAFGDATATISTGPQLTMVNFVISEGILVVLTHSVILFTYPLPPTASHPLVLYTTTACTECLSWSTCSAP